MECDITISITCPEDQDMRILGVKNWKKVALDRDEWANLLKKARAHQGLSSQWWWWHRTENLPKEVDTQVDFSLCTPRRHIGERSLSSTNSRQWGHWDFSLTDSFGLTMVLGSTKPLIEISTRGISWGVKAAGV